MQASDVAHVKAPKPAFAKRLKDRLPTGQPAFRCDVCKQVCLIWLHRCPKCGEFNTFNTECLASKFKPVSESSESETLGTPASDAKKKKDEKALFTPLGEIDPRDPPRIPSGDDGLNHVLGGGIVMGSIVLLFGAPGSGKSTLITTVSACIADQFKVWYAIGEHGKERVRRLADRLKLGKRSRESVKNLIVLDEVSKDTDTLCRYLKEKKGPDQPVLVVIDSMMSIQSEDCTGTPGGASQVKYAALKFREIAEDTGMAVIGIAHVTNDGSLAGPSQAKHFVDTLLMLEHVKIIPDKETGILTFKQIPKRIPGKPSFLRLAAFNKNRDGDVAACAYYKMTATGLKLIALADEENLEWLEDPQALMFPKSARLGTSHEPKARAKPRQRAGARNQSRAAARTRRQARKARVLR